MIPVIWLSYTENEHPADKWDAGLLHLLFKNELWNPVGGQTFEYWAACSLEDFTGGAVVVFPAGIHREQYDRLNADLAHLEWVLLILTADEGSLFETKHVHHPNLLMWVMTPRPDYVYPPGTRFIGEGFKEDTPSILAAAKHDTRSLDWFFSGQVTHERRTGMTGRLVPTEMETKRHNYVNQWTSGFCLGYARDYYLSRFADTKVAPCPSGPVTPDSFRLYEALESGCLPIADDLCPDYDTPGYWDMVAPGHPFPTLTDLDDWPELVSNAVNDWPGNANHSFAWWQSHKRTMAYWLVEDLTTLGAPMEPHDGFRDRITAIVCTSPIPSHPSTAIIEQTVASIRERLPDVEIIIGIDGIRDEQQAEWVAEGHEQRRADYEEYTRRLLWLCNHEWSNVLPMVFGPHAHQSGMAVAAMQLVRTPYVFYVEGDLPVCGEIPFEGFCECLADGTADLIRLTLNTDLEPAHMHLMLDGGEIQEHHGVPMVRTVQWSQQPHLATASYYRSILEQYFEPGETWYIEWRMHSICAGLWTKDGPIAWFRNRLWIYTPPGNMCRVIHLDGRAGDTVFDV